MFTIDFLVSKPFLIQWIPGMHSLIGESENDDLAYVVKHTTTILTLDDIRSVYRGEWLNDQVYCKARQLVSLICTIGKSQNYQFIILTIIYRWLTTSWSTLHQQLYWRKAWTTVHCPARYIWSWKWTTSNSWRNTCRCEQWKFNHEYLYFFILLIGQHFKNGLSFSTLLCLTPLDSLCMLKKLVHSATTCYVNEFFRWCDRGARLLGYMTQCKGCTSAQV